MNCLILDPQELIGGAQACLRGDRATALHAEMEISPGQTIRVGVRDGPLGRATILRAENESIELALELIQPSPPLLPIHLIVGVPRPQTVRKLLLLASTVGVSSLLFVRSEYGEKSYLNSKALKSQEIERMVLLGLQQSCATISPRVELHPNFKPFLEEYLPSLNEFKSSTKIVAQPEYQTPDKNNQGNLEASHITGPKENDFFLAVGGESGWSSYENGAFLQAGFNSVSLGPRVLRVETAAALLLGHMLRGQARGNHTLSG